jgi:hypothetical protein
MIDVMSRSAGKVVGLRVSGKLLHEDYAAFLPKVEALIEQYGCVRCLVEMTGFEGMELRAFWDEVKFDVRHSRQIERCAVVGDKTWESWMTRLSRPLFPNADMRFFEPAAIDQAWTWVEEGL